PGSLGRAPTGSPPGDHPPLPPALRVRPAAFRSWLSGGRPPVDRPVTWQAWLISARSTLIHDAVMALPPDERRDRERVNEAVREGLRLGPAVRINTATRSCHRLPGEQAPIYGRTPLRQPADFPRTLCLDSPCF